MPVTDPNAKRPRTFQCRDVIWEALEQMAGDLECSVDYLINEALKQYVRQRNPRTPAMQLRDEPVLSPTSPVPVSSMRQGSTSPITPTPSPAYDALSGRSGPGPIPMPPPIVAPPPTGPLPSPPFGGGLPAPMGLQGGPASLESGPPGGNPIPSPVPPIASPYAGALAPQAGGGVRPMTQAERPTNPHIQIGPPPLPTNYQPPRYPPQSPPAGVGASVHTGSPVRNMTPTGPLAPLSAPHLPPLTVIYAGQRHPVTKDRFIIGRGRQGVDLTIKDPNISRQHAMIEFHGGQFFIIDMGSTNGLEHNGERVNRKALGEGDMVRICEHELRVTFRRDV